MTNELLFAGFGGQGILFAGKAIAYAGMIHDKKVSWLPSYGPEMRGGTANCHVIVSDEPVSSPLVVNPTTLIAMNLPSLDKFEDAVVSGGNIIVDSSLITRDIKRKDVNVVKISATEMAHSANANKLANMIMIGALLKTTGLYTMDEIKIAMDKLVPKAKPELLELNIKMIQMGYDA